MRHFLVEKCACLKRWCRPPKQWRSWEVRPLFTGWKPTGSRVVWKPVAFTLTVGGATCILSGMHTSIHQRRRTNFQSTDSKGALEKVKKWWSDIGPAYRFFSVVLGVNTLIFASWRIPALHSSMEKYFLTGLDKKGSLHLLLNVFSHHSFWHLVCNMIVLHSCVTVTCACLGDFRNNSCASIAPFYLTAGVFASTVSFYVKLLKVSLPAASLGASGAIYAVATLAIMSFPDMKVRLLFFPFVPVDASMFLGTAVVLDAIGLIRGWKFFDHAAHLGGFVFAVLYKKWLHEKFVRLRFATTRVCNKVWRDIR